MRTFFGLASATAVGATTVSLNLPHDQGTMEYDGSQNTIQVKTGSCEYRFFDVVPRFTSIIEKHAVPDPIGRDIAICMTEQVEPLEADVDPVIGDPRPIGHVDVTFVGSTPLISCMGEGQKAGSIVTYTDNFDSLGIRSLWANANEKPGLVGHMGRGLKRAFGGTLNLIAIPDTDEYISRSKAKAFCERLDSARRNIENRILEAYGCASIRFEDAKIRSCRIGDAAVTVFQGNDCAYKFPGLGVVFTPTTLAEIRTGSTGLSLGTLMTTGGETPFCPVSDPSITCPHTGTYSGHNAPVNSGTPENEVFCAKLDLIREKTRNVLNELYSKAVVRHEISDSEQIVVRKFEPSFELVVEGPKPSNMDGTRFRMRPIRIESERSNSDERSFQMWRIVFPSGFVLSDAARKAFQSRRFQLTKYKDNLNSQLVRERLSSVTLVNPEFYIQYGKTKCSRDGLLVGSIYAPGLNAENAQKACAFLSIILDEVMAASP